MTSPDLRREAAPFLLWLAFKGAVTRDDITLRWSAEGSVDDLLRGLLAGGFIGEDDGCIFMDDRGDELLHEACRGALTEDERPAFQAFVAQFGPIDAAVKEAVSRWQSSPRSAETLDKEALVAVDDWMEAHRQLLSAVASADPVVSRVLAAHLADLDDAVERFEGGDLDAFSGGADDSYHTHWFVMHELILRSAGIRR